MALKPCVGCGREVDTTAKACPQCGRPNPTITGKSKVIGGVVTALLLAGVGSAICSPSSSSTSSSTSQASAAAAAPAPSAPPVEVSAQELYAAYSENEVAADWQYKNRRLLVGGTIESIDKDMFNNMVLHLKTKNELSPVMATLADSEASKAANLRKRQRVTLLCRGGTRIVDSPTLDKCVIQ